MPYAVCVCRVAESAVSRSGWSRRPGSSRTPRRCAQGGAGGPVGATGSPYSCCAGLPDPTPRRLRVRRCASDSRPSRAIPRCSSAGGSSARAAASTARRATIPVGQRDLHREVDAAGALRECDLEVLDPVRREDESDVDVDVDVGVGVEAVERVEHLEEQGRRAHREGAVLGDEVAVLEDDDRRLVRTRDLGGVVDEAERSAAQQDRRRARRRGEQVAHGVCLAGAGRTVEQDTTLDTPAIPGP